MTATRRSPTIGVVHATPLSITPVTEAMAAEFPAARLRNVLDDSLLDDLQVAGELTSGLQTRMERLIDHLLVDPLDALQFACSGYSPVVDRTAARLTIPVRKPDEAMYRGLASGGHAHLAIVATVQPALDLAVSQLRSLMRGPTTARITSRCVPEALEAAKRGENERLAQLLTRTIVDLDDDVEVVALAQYSMSPVASAITEATGRDVVTGPRAAARDLRDALGA